MGSLLVKVKTKMSIHAHEKVRGLLEGQYGSVFKGRSMDFDDLREYIPGDDVKDIDWKATARSGQTRIKRYVAVRKHNILLVVDTGRDMAALSDGGDVKKDVSVMAAGVIGYIAQKHGDLVALVAGNAEGSKYLPLKSSNDHLERILQHIDAGANLEGTPSDLTVQLEYIARTIRRRMMLIIISDDGLLTKKHEKLLRRLGAQHEIMWLTVGDANICDEKWQNDIMEEIDDRLAIPQFLRKSKKLEQEFLSSTKSQHEQFMASANRLGISSERIAGEEDVVSGIFKLLERQRSARRK